MIKGVHHVALTVRGEAAASQFYAGAADMQLCADADAQLALTALPGIAASTLLKSGNSYFRILSAPQSAAVSDIRRPVSQAGIVHICLQSPKIEQLHAKFEAEGADFHAPLVGLGTGFLYAYARDLEGNVVEIEGVMPVWEDPKPWVAHVSYSSHDRDRLAQFYADVLGQGKGSSPEIGPRSAIDKVSGLSQTRFKAAWMPTVNMQVEVIQYLNPATVAHEAKRQFSDLGYAYVAFEVTELESERARLLELGATQDAQLAALSGAQHAFMADPDGNFLLLLCLGRAREALSIAALPDPAVVARMSLAREALSKKAST